MFHTGSIRVAAFSNIVSLLSRRITQSCGEGDMLENIQVEWPTRICKLEAWQEGVGERVGDGKYIFFLPLLQ